MIENDKIIGGGQVECITEGIINIAVDKELFDAVGEDRRQNNGQSVKYMYSDGEIVINPDYETIMTEKRETGFKKDFFETSLGWIRRKPTLADGTEDDFLNNDLPLLAIGLMTGSNPVLPIAYQLPDFTHELTTEYMESLQIKNQPVTQQFIAECSQVKMKDFTGI